ncbi:MAG: NAD(P)-dependent oxidoreductase [Candidatus Nitrohelix vancouverensis]|uniref:NAD(P)-dependent oxidoreductase n=1 Tax=Candidatus Nitrohelix vancouverensis TaxID=2705534 RepID=A0A7T0C292_9BACT|nr:MAG: NAD(P)-dependent oxidoreductase [Candidatus Nitrohelix vancouverensis]
MRKTPDQKSTPAIGVTGASGFIGSHLTNALRASRSGEISPLNRANGKSVPGVAVLRKFATNLDLIYHLGGVNRASSKEIIEGNVLYMSHLVEALQSLPEPRPRVIFMSSALVYAITGDNFKIRESQATRPETLYGVCKKAAEDILHASGLDHTILRFTNIYGPGCRPDYNSTIATFCDRAIRGEAVCIHGDGEQSRNFLYIDDAIRALIQAGKVPAKRGARIYNVGSGTMISLNQIAAQIKRQVPGLSVERDTKKSGGLSYGCDVTRFSKRFQWKPKVALNEGIRQTLDWFSERQKK